MTLVDKNRSDVSLKKKLDYHYKYFNFDQISPDPLEFLHRYKDYFDIEISALLSSVFAYGNVKQIIKTLDKIHGIMEAQPHDFIKSYNYKKDKQLFDSVVHRFYSSDDIAKLFRGLHEIYSSYSSLKEFYLLHYESGADDLKDSIHLFSENIIKSIAGKKDASRGVIFMFPDPFKGSACKRMNLMLRWLVRKDELDFGLWSEIDKSRLVIPVDTHVAKICKQLGLTTQKSASWKMAEEITNNLKRFDKDDPVKYDFAICHIGMRKLKF